MLPILTNHVLGVRQHASKKQQFGALQALPHILLYVREPWYTGNDASGLELIPFSSAYYLSLYSERRILAGERKACRGLQIIIELL